MKCILLRRGFVKVRGFRILLGGLLGASQMVTAYAADITAAVTLQRGHIIEPGDIKATPSTTEQAYRSLDKYIGQQMRRTIYAGARLNQNHVTRPILIKRNTRINMSYRIGRLEMTASGRALDEGGEGEVISVMNLESKRRVQGVILPDGSVEVTK